MDKKKQIEPQWDNNVEQEIFGNQAPYANTNTVQPPDEPFIFPHYPAQQPYLENPYSQPPPQSNKAAFRDDVQVPADAPPVYSKAPTPIAPPQPSIPQPKAAAAPPSLAAIPPPRAIAPSQSATAPPTPTAAAPIPTQTPTATAPPAHPQPQIQARPEEPLPRILPAQTRQAPYPSQQPPYLPQQPSQPPTSSEHAAPPHSSQFHSPTTPITHQSPRPEQQPQPPHSAPVSYGSIRPQGYDRPPQSLRPRASVASDSESCNSSDDEEEQFAARERRRRRKAIKKHLSECSCNKICWFLIFLVLLSFWTSPIEKSIKDPCTLMAERRLEPDLYFYALGMPTNNTVINIDVREHILGNITATEADNWVQKGIHLYVYKTLSHKDLDDVVEYRYSFDDRYNILSHWADLKTDDREKNANIMKSHCARIDYHIIFPKDSDIKRLAVRTHSGDIRLRTDSISVIFEQMYLETGTGDVLFEAGNVRANTTIRTDRGKIQGTVKTLEHVEASTTMGDISLVVDTSAGLLDGWTTKFNVTLQSAKSAINLGLTERYKGRFLLESGIDKPTFALSPNYTDVVTIKRSSANMIAGWVSARSSREEPSSQLPSVSAHAKSGLVNARVQSKSKKEK
ncbi:hypothetical protein BGX29_006394 [Mortierella sp. GBA35]|nr:hypothetical protein BGX29_006394 [Mortierella sp. GBA35]